MQPTLSAAPIKGKSIGGFGRCEVFSFHATKFFNTFEGGAVLTNDDVLAEKMGLMRNFGFRGYDNVIYIGTNGKMTEVCAAMGLTSLESVEEFIRDQSPELPGIPARAGWNSGRECDGIRRKRADELPVHCVGSG